MSTPDKPEVDPRFIEGDVYHDPESGGVLLYRDRGGRWLTAWGLWTLSDQHMADAGLVNGFWEPDAANSANSTS